MTKTEQAIRKIESADRPLTMAEAFGHIRYSKQQVNAEYTALASGRVKRTHIQTGERSRTVGYIKA